MADAIPNLIWVIPQDQDEAMDDPPACDPQIAANPFLVLLVRSLFLFSELDMPELTSDLVKHCMDASISAVMLAGAMFLRLLIL